MATYKITNLGTPTVSTDAANKAYVDANTGLSQSTADSRYYLNSVVLNSITAPTGNLSMATYKITNLGTPTVSTDASTKAYVDALVPVGTILIWSTNTAPTGYLICNG